MQKLSATTKAINAHSTPKSATAMAYSGHHRGHSHGAGLALNVRHVNLFLSTVVQVCLEKRNVFLHMVVALMSVIDDELIWMSWIVYTFSKVACSFIVFLLQSENDFSAFMWRVILLLLLLLLLYLLLLLLFT